MSDWVPTWRTEDVEEWGGLRLEQWGTWAFPQGTEEPWQVLGRLGTGSGLYLKKTLLPVIVAWSEEGKAGAKWWGV